MQPKLHRIAKKLSHWLNKSTNTFLLYFPSLLANTTYMALYSLKMKLLKELQGWEHSYLMTIINHYVIVTNKES